MVVTHPPSTPRSLLFGRPFGKVRPTEESRSLGESRRRSTRGVLRTGSLKLNLVNRDLGGGFNIFHFHPYLGKIPILTNIFPCMVYEIIPIYNWVVFPKQLGFFFVAQMNLKIGRVPKKETIVWNTILF